jgi:hypothetical protein
MTAVTLTTRFDGVPAHDMVILELSDGETYKSKLSRVFGAHVKSADDTDGYLNYTVSGNTITVNYAGATDKVVYIDCVGQL